MQAPLDWDKMIATEQHRLYRLYRFINLFTDVPEITAQIKRRKYLDGILSKITFNQKNTYLYLYARRFIRGTEFSGLYLRLLGLGSILLVFITERWFALGVGVLFIYLIGFQLLPLYHQFQYMTSAQLYPVAEQQKLSALQTLLRMALLVVALIFSVISSLVVASWMDRGIIVLSFFVIAVLFVELYVPYRLKKNQ
jgi:ABC-2 type transport system permease protein